MDLHELISTHGYWVLTLGCLLEGETLLVLAGFAASRGDLDIFTVVAIAAAAGFVGDQFFFWLGRVHGTAVLARFPSVAQQGERVFHLIERYQAWVVIGVRFAYGLRIAGPILIGTSRIPASRFLIFNALGAMIWAPLVAGIGYVFGEAAEAVLGQMHDIELWLVLALLAAVGLITFIQWLRARSRMSQVKDR